MMIRDCLHSIPTQLRGYTIMTVLSVDPKGPIVLVDGGYFVFHRFFATLKWYRFRNNEVDEGTCMGIEEFRAALEKHVLADIDKVRKRCCALATGKQRLSKKEWQDIPVWVAADCSRSCIWRSALTEGYKGTRDGSRAAFDPTCFEAIYTVLKDRLPVLRADALEADDLVALTHRRLREIGYEGLIMCVTNDNDYLQLMDDKTRIVNLEEKDLAARSCGSPKRDLLLKVLLGDKSDNIPPVRAKLSEKALREKDGLCDEELVGSLCLSQQELERMELNRTLIDFSRIPSHLAESYYCSHDIAML